VGHVTCFPRLRTGLQGHVTSPWKPALHPRGGCHIPLEACPAPSGAMSHPPGSLLCTLGGHVTSPRGSEPGFGAMSHGSKRMKRQPCRAHHVVREGERRPCRAHHVAPGGGRQPCRAHHVALRGCAILASAAAAAQPVTTRELSGSHVNTAGRPFAEQAPSREAQRLPCYARLGDYSVSYRLLAGTDALCRARCRNADLADAAFGAIAA
jgi:hypothetical protein